MIGQEWEQAIQTVKFTKQIVHLLMFIEIYQ